MRKTTAKPAAAEADQGGHDVGESPADEPLNERPEPAAPKEIGGRDGPEPTRFGDWEKNGRCIDF